MKRLFVFLALSPFLFSCKRTNDLPIEENFFFEQPQPVNDSELNKFPSKFLGKYVDKDSMYFEIQKTIMLSGSDHKVKFHKKEMDSLAKMGLSYSAGRVTEMETGKSYTTTVVGDSIMVDFKYRDTIFQFSNSQKAKRINGCLVLSYKDSIYWRVKYLSLDKGRLSIKTLAFDTDIQKLDSITKIKSVKLDSATYVFTPSRHEFSRILKCRTLGYESVYDLLK